MAEDTKLIIEILNDLRTDMNKMDDRLRTMDNRLETMDDRLGNVENRLGKLEALPQDVTEMKMTLENETNRNIKLIAEGHFDLSRKLNEALQLDQEKELLNVRLNILENEVKILKQHIVTA